MTMTIKRFEDIRAWQEARILTKQVYSLCKISQDSAMTDGYATNCRQPQFR